MIRFTQVKSYATAAVNRITLKESAGKRNTYAITVQGERASGSDGQADDDADSERNDTTGWSTSKNNFDHSPNEKGNIKTDLDINELYTKIPNKKRKLK